MFVANGNGYFWDYTNQLTELYSKTGAHIEQRYDAFGRRVFERNGVDAAYTAKRFVYMSEDVVYDIVNEWIETNQKIADSVQDAT